jgi:hypothetical protein
LLPPPELNHWRLDMLIPDVTLRRPAIFTRLVGVGTGVILLAYLANYITNGAVWAGAAMIYAGLWGAVEFFIGDRGERNAPK